MLTHSSLSWARHCPSPAVQVGEESKRLPHLPLSLRASRPPRKLCVLCDRSPWLRDMPAAQWHHRRRGLELCLAPRKPRMVLPPSLGLSPPLCSGKAGRREIAALKWEVTVRCGCTSSSQPL